jgi:hypothetical protein
MDISGSNIKKYVLIDINMEVDNMEAEASAPNEMLPWFGTSVRD